jgi:tetratricopeptide (TPR) repeat protein
MRDDLDFDLVDKHLEEYADTLEWQTENSAIRFSFNLALESIRDHEIDRGVWTLKKAVEASTDGDGINHAIFQILIKSGLYQEAVEVLRAAIEKGFQDWYFKYNLAFCLFELDEIQEAEAICVSGLFGEVSEGCHLYLHLLAEIRDSQGRFIEAKALAQEAISNPRINDNDELSNTYYNLSLYCEKLGFIDDAIEAAKSGVAVDKNPESIDWDSLIERLQKLCTQPPNGESSTLHQDLEPKKLYEDWFIEGAFWHQYIPLDFFHGSRGFLEELYENGATWSDESVLLFDDYWLDEDSLEESLARVESLSGHIHLQPSWPVFLETPDISIAMTINQSFLLAWVGKDLDGLLVGVNVKTWDVFHAEDPDARFAVGAVLNWFLDCSLNISSHEMFDRMPNKWIEIERPWEPKYLTTWSTTTIFHDDIENMRRYVDRRPPIAHRVRGHIRTLSERQPTDEARENAPAYIRRNMGPTDTFVRSYTKSGEIGTEKLLNHLSTNSSLADFLGTAPLFESD